MISFFLFPLSDQLGIFINDQAAKGTMPVTEVVVIFARLEPYDPVNIAAKGANLGFFIL